MRRETLFTIAAIVCATLALPTFAFAQDVAGPTIHNVMIDDASGVLTISGHGFGDDPAVTVDGQPVTVLQAGTTTQIQILAPAAVMLTPGSYRLTVVDPGRQRGDAFVVARSAPVPPIAITGGAVASSPRSAATSPSTPSLATPVGGSEGPPAADGPGSLLIEGPDNTAVGQFALVTNTSGLANTALGRSALQFNTTGQQNTATGYFALIANTTGHQNTASGYRSLNTNTTGAGNTAIGSLALMRNTTGHQNTAAGQGAMIENTSGTDNTASGTNALQKNTTGNNNTATGAYALLRNTTGSNNAAGGYWALLDNTTGFDNTASGAEALRDNTTGRSNTATGRLALAANTSGGFNTATGRLALQANTVGQWNVALGHGAGSNATTGSFNLFLGAGVIGTAGDTNTIRIGLPYDSVAGEGQNQTYIAGIHGTQLSGPAVPVFVDANGQLGTLTAPIASGSGTTPVALALPQQATITALQQQVRDQQSTIDELRARLARVEAQLTSPKGRK